MPPLIGGARSLTLPLASTAGLGVEPFAESPFVLLRRFPLLSRENCTLDWADAEQPDQNKQMTIRANLMGVLVCRYITTFRYTSSGVYPEEIQFQRN
jgi:hypothetical protein